MEKVALLLPGHGAGAGTLAAGQDNLSVRARATVLCRQGHPEAKKASGVTRTVADRPRNVRLPRQTVLATGFVLSPIPNPFSKTALTPDSGGGSCAPP